MKFRIRTKKVGTSDDTAWWETYEKDTQDPTQWGKDIIDYFNSTLHPGESARVFIEAEIIDEETGDPEHSWNKTNSVTIVKGSTNYDTVKCSRCGVTGKRYGLGRGTINFDRKFKPKVYERCDTAQAHLEKKRNKK